MNSEELATLKAVCEQRDRAREALAKLVDSFWSAHYNHAFDAEDTRYVEKDGEIEKDENGRKKEYCCSAGRSLMSCFKGCNLFDKEGVCKGYDCPMGFHHRRMYERVREANGVLDERAAEFVPFDLDRIPKYDKTKKYEVTAEWYARMCLMFFNGFSLTKEYTKEQCEKMGEAASNIACIGLATFGVHFPVECANDDKNGKKVSEDDPRIVEWNESMKPLIEKFADRDAKVEEKGIVDCLELFTGDEEYARWYIVKQSVTFLGEFAFGRDYPSADLGVYGDVLCGLKWVCTRVCGLPEEDFAVIQNLNDVSLDRVGFVEKEA